MYLHGERLNWSKLRLTWNSWAQRLRIVHYIYSSLVSYCERLFLFSEAFQLWLKACPIEGEVCACMRTWTRTCWACNKVAVRCTLPCSLHDDLIHPATLRCFLFDQTIFQLFRFSDSEKFWRCRPPISSTCSHKVVPVKHALPTANFVSVAKISLMKIKGSEVRIMMAVYNELKRSLPACLTSKHLPLPVLVPCTAPPRKYCDYDCYEFKVHDSIHWLF